MANIFKDLSKYGFTDVTSKNLFKDKNEDKQQDSTPNNQNQLFVKEIECPICNNKFKTLVVKVNAPRVISKDSDFFVRYASINPYFYEVWVCNHCGYAALKNEFNKVRSFQIPLIQEHITSKWKSREFPIAFTEEIAIERYKLALLTAMISNAKNSTKSILCLKIAWMYRLLDKTDDEIQLLSQAIKGFIEAYTNESFPIYGLDKFSIMYLIGELYRRTNCEKEALTWYSRVITTIGAPHKTKELCRNGRDIIKGLY